MLREVKIKNKKYDLLTLKVHIFRAMCIWKPYMKNIPYPLPMGGIFKDNNFWTTYYIFIYYLLVCTQDIGTRTINGSFYTVNLISEKTGCIYLFNSSYLSQGLPIKISLVISVGDVM